MVFTSTRHPVPGTDYALYINYRDRELVTPPERYPPREWRSSLIGYVVIGEGSKLLKSKNQPFHVRPRWSSDAAAGKSFGPKGKQLDSYILALNEVPPSSSGSDKSPRSLFQEYMEAKRAASEDNRRRRENEDQAADAAALQAKKDAADEKKRVAEENTVDACITKVRVRINDYIDEFDRRVGNNYNETNRINAAVEILNLPFQSNFSQRKSYLDLMVELRKMKSEGKINEDNYKNNLTLTPIQRISANNTKTNERCAYVELELLKTIAYKEGVSESDRTASIAAQKENIGALKKLSKQINQERDYLDPETPTTEGGRRSTKRRHKRTKRKHHKKTKRKQHKKTKKMRKNARSKKRSLRKR